MLTVGVLLPLACVVLTLGWMIGAMIYFHVRDRRAERSCPGGNAASTTAQSRAPRICRH